ncbi:hypothetical protein F511_28308 [Dorcoceras hygrometricum]|uniref:Uncharacterized protein n=1 Tax=Dorcoceras hygrometricum TaxID=472368 RepID=A0A2Z7ASC3_9LAMI|nr:hypothetical protein F511_28308 [Dorcoceras hygrometricum]
MQQQNSRKQFSLAAVKPPFGGSGGGDYHHFDDVGPQRLHPDQDFDEAIVVKTPPVSLFILLITLYSDIRERFLYEVLSGPAAVDTPIRSTTGINLPPSICTRRLDGFRHGRNHLVTVIEKSPITKRAADGGGTRRRKAAAGGVREVVEKGGGRL